MENIHIETNNEDAIPIKISDLNSYKKVNLKLNKQNLSKSNTSNLNTNFKTKNSNQINSISSLSKTNPDPSKSINKNCFDREIIKQIEDFRYKLNEELLTMLTVEKQKEENREHALISCHEKKERKKLEKLFGMERAQAANKINLFSE